MNIDFEDPVVADVARRIGMATLPASAPVLANVAGEIGVSPEQLVQGIVLAHVYGISSAIASMSHLPGADELDALGMVKAAHEKLKADLFG